MECPALAGIFTAVATLPDHPCPYLRKSGFNSVACWAFWLARHWQATGCGACPLVDNLLYTLQCEELWSCSSEHRGCMQAMIYAHEFQLIAQIQNPTTYLLSCCSIPGQPVLRSCQ